MNVFRSILITGGNGMLAHALVRNLVARHHPATVLDRANCDVTNGEKLRSVFARHKPTLLFNCAAHTKVDLCERQQDLANAINGHAVGSIAKLTKEFGTYLVHFSTDFVFDGKGKRPYRADDPIGPLSAYGKSKLLGEQALQADAPDRWLIARTAWLYGRNGPNFPRTMVERGRANQPLKVVTDQVGSPTYTEDLAAAAIDLVEQNAIGLWHLTNSGQTNWHAFACAALEEFGVKADVGQTTSAEWFKARPNSAIRPSYSVLDTEPYAKLTGHPMRPWREALRDYATAVKQAGF